ncbi:YncE family protein [Gordonia araii NBRC 100433]|nr:YncE family protein [Gordonia araii NBRC 100433]
MPPVLVAGLVPVLSLVAASPMSGAAPGGAYNVASIPAGVTEGAELAIDPGRRSVFIADGDDYNQKDDTVGAVVPYPHQLRPKVAVVNLDSRRVKRTIDYAPLPNGRTTMGPLTVPMPQVPVGLAVDPARGRVLTTSARAGGAAIVDMGATRARPSDMIRTSIPLKHVMGVAADPVSGRAYIANSNADAVMVVDTATRGELAVIRGVYRPSLLSVDPGRGRVYVGNADTKAKKTNYVAVIDAKTNAVVKKIATAPNSRPSVDPATGRVYAASFATGEIAVIDPDTLTVAKRIRTGTTPVNVAIDAQRRLAYTANLFKRSITVIDLDSDRVVATVPTARRPHTVAVDPRTGLVLATEFQSPNLTVLTAKSATRGRG